MREVDKSVTPTEKTMSRYRHDAVAVQICCAGSAESAGSVQVVQTQCRQNDRLPTRLKMLIIRSFYAISADKCKSDSKMSDVRACARETLSARPMMARCHKCHS